MGKNIFVSYTIRDNIVNAEFLQRIEKFLNEFGKPFIDLLAKFLNLFKSQNLTLDEVRVKAKCYEDWQRHIAFLDIFTRTALPYPPEDRVDINQADQPDLTDFERLLPWQLLSFMSQKGLSQKTVTLERSPVPGRTERGEGSHRLIRRFFTSFRTGLLVGRGED